MGSKLQEPNGPSAVTNKLGEVILFSLAQTVLVVKLTTELFMIVPEQFVYVKL